MVAQSLKGMAIAYRSFHSGQRITVIDSVTCVSVPYLRCPGPFRAQR